MPRIFAMQFMGVDAVQPVYFWAIIVDASGVQFDLKKHELEAYEAALKEVRK